MEFLIREMTDYDWTRVSKIYKDAITEGKSTFQTVCPSYQQWDSSHKKDCRFVAVSDGVISGWCAISSTSSRECFCGVVEVSIYIDKKYRGNGIGSALINYLCRTCFDKGYWCLYSSIFSENLSSIELHKKCGFREIGYRERIAKDIFGNWRNITILENRLAEK